MIVELGCNSQSVGSTYVYRAGTKQQFLMFIAFAHFKILAAKKSIALYLNMLLESSNIICKQKEETISALNNIVFPYCSVLYKKVVLHQIISH